MRLVPATWSAVVWPAIWSGECGTPEIVAASVAIGRVVAIAAKVVIRRSRPLTRSPESSPATGSMSIDLDPT